MTTKNDWIEKELRKYSEGMIAVTIPVNQRVEEKQKIVDLVAAEELLRTAHIISLGTMVVRKE